MTTKVINQPDSNNFPLIMHLLEKVLKYTAQMGMMKSDIKIKLKWSTTLKQKLSQNLHVSALWGKEFMILSPVSVAIFLNLEDA